MGIKTKIIVAIVAAVIALNIFLPDKAEEAIEMISGAIGISEDSIQQGVDLATDITTDTAEIIQDEVEDAIDD